MCNCYETRRNVNTTPSTQRVPAPTHRTRMTEQPTQQPTRQPTTRPTTRQSTQSNTGNVTTLLLLLASAELNFFQFSLASNMLWSSPNNICAIVIFYIVTVVDCIFLLTPLKLIKIGRPI